MEHVSAALSRAVRTVARRTRLAPLEPDAFLAWMRHHDRIPRNRGVCTVDDLWFGFWGRLDPGLTLKETRRLVVWMAARVRRNQRLGLDPFEGIC